jgi:hypothetical protein
MHTQKKPQPKVRKAINRKPQNGQDPVRVLEKLKKIVEQFDRLPTLDNRSADEILGYDEHGVPR